MAARRAISAEVKAAVIAAHGRDTATALCARYGLTRDQVLGLWHRRPRDTPEELAKVAARAEEAEAAAAPFTPETAPFTGQVGAAWRAILAAGVAGATAAVIRAALYPDGGEPPSSQFVFYEVIRRLRRSAEEHGFTVALIENVKPSRWRVQRSDDRSAAVTPAEAGPAAVRPQPAPEPSIGGRSGDAALLPKAGLWLASAAAPVVFSGVALAVAELGSRACRWPIGEPGATGFCFCGDRVFVEGQSYCAGHRRKATAGQGSPRVAA